MLAGPPSPEVHFDFIKPHVVGDATHRVRISQTCVELDLYRRKLCTAHGLCAGFLANHSTLHLQCRRHYENLSEDVIFVIAWEQSIDAVLMVDAVYYAMRSYIAMSTRTHTHPKNQNKA